MKYAFNITPEILSLISDLNEFKGEWKFLSQLEPDKLASLKKVASIESIGSSTRIEGSKLSDKEVEIILSNLDQESFRSRDEQEVAGYAFVCNEIFANYEYMDFSENLIKQIHKWLLKYSEKDERHRGGYKTLSNSVEAHGPSGEFLGVVFETATPFETPFKIAELVEWTNQEFDKKEIHPLIIIAIFIVDFLAIHPFQDGNGRLFRCLTNLLLLKSGYLYVPYSSLETVIEDNKKNYYLSLRQTQQSLKTESPNFEPWILFFLRSLQKQKNILACKLGQYREISSGLSALSIEILSLLSSHGQLSVGDLEKLTKTNRSTIKNRLSDLIASYHILRH